MDLDNQMVDINTHNQALEDGAQMIDLHATN